MGSQWGQLDGWSLPRGTPWWSIQSGVSAPLPCAISALPSGVSHVLRVHLKRAPVVQDRYLVDSASSHMLVSKIKPCMSKYKQLYRETANGSLNQLSFI